MGLDIAKSGNASSKARIIHFRVSLIRHFPEFCVFTYYRNGVPRASTKFYNWIFPLGGPIISGESPVNVSLAIIRDNSYLTENMIFWTKKSKFYQTTRDKLWTGLFQCINRCGKTCEKSVCILLLVASMKLTEFLNLPFIKSGIDLKDYFLSFKMIPNMTYF